MQRDSHADTFKNHLAHFSLVPSNSKVKFTFPDVEYVSSGKITAIGNQYGVFNLRELIFSLIFPNSGPNINEIKRQTSLMLCSAVQLDTRGYLVANQDAKPPRVYTRKETCALATFLQNVCANKLNLSYPLTDNAATLYFLSLATKQVGPNFILHNLTGKISHIPGSDIAVPDKVSRLLFEAAEQPWERYIIDMIRPGSDRKVDPVMAKMHAIIACTPVMAKNAYKTNKVSKGSNIIGEKVGKYNEDPFPNDGDIPTTKEAYLWHKSMAVTLMSFGLTLSAAARRELTTTPFWDQEYASYPELRAPAVVFDTITSSARRKGAFQDEHDPAESYLTSSFPGRSGYQIYETISSFGGSLSGSTQSLSFTQDRLGDRTSTDDDSP